MQRSSILQIMCFMLTLLALTLFQTFRTLHEQDQSTTTISSNKVVRSRDPKGAEPDSTDNYSFNYFA